MKTTVTLFLTASILGFAGSPVMADCKDKTGSVAMKQQPAGIAKDGTHAPLDTNKAASADTPTVAKDGKTMPLANQEGGGDKNLATSEQDVKAQQQGDKTAAALAETDCK